MYALKYLPTLDNLPASLRNEVFEKLFEQARIAKLTKKEQNNYYKSLSDMSIVKNELAKRDNVIFSLQQVNTSLQQNYTSLQQGYTSLQKDNAAKDARIAELERQMGLKK